MVVLKFGKYKNQELEDIFSKDEPYCFWMWKWSQIKGYPEIYEFLKNKFKDGDDFYMYYGKHKNKSISWINDNDQPYLHYLKNNIFAQSVPELVKALENY
jgi:hypothetical protein